MHLPTKEAYLNEYKGNLYEFLVAKELAQKCNLSTHLYSNLSNEFHKQLVEYETQIRKFSPDLISSLPPLARELSDKILEKVEGELKNIYLIGKVASGSHDKRWAEADIVLVGDKNYPISVKLSKQNAYVNTKSAGLRSFFSLYFSNDEIQEGFNQELDYLFENFCEKIHQQMDIPYDGSFRNWIEHGLPELPGVLSDDAKEVLHSYYYQLAKLVYEKLLTIEQSNKKEFTSMLLPLIGQGSQDIIQATTFYSSKGKENAKHEMSSLDELEKHSREVVVNPPKEGTGNFEIHLFNLALQIRVKPMNKFTTSSYKLNCSIKIRD